MPKQQSWSIKDPKPNGLIISRDNAGVPYIKSNEYQGVIWGSGYAHGIDRSTQLLMMRILGQGRLCELLSDNEESLAIDSFFRRANWHNNIDQEIAKLDKSAYVLCQAYCDGINAGLAVKPFTLLRGMGYQHEPWTIKDSILVSRMASYLTLAQSQAEVERLFIELVQAGISFERLSELFPISMNSFDRELIESIELQEKIVPSEVVWNKALPRMMASNNWVIAGSKTASGQAIMANDPHLEVNRLPNVWCEQYMQWSGNSVMGMGMPGLPGIIIGRTPAIAWGATYTFMDTIDSWVEECKAGQYLRDGEWHDFSQRVEIIKRKKHQDHQLTFYENDHGVLAGDPFKAGKYLSTRWAAAESGSKSLNASLKLAIANNAAQAMSLLGEFESAWNWVISDTAGNIAYQMSGIMPKRKAGWNGFTPAPGWDSSYNWQGAVATKDLPCCLNPKEGYIVTANQDLNHLGKANPINMPMGDYRSKRIESVLAASNQHDVESTQKLQFDAYSLQAKQFLAVLLPILEKNSEQSEAYNVLKNWDCFYDLESVGAPLFELFYEALRLNIFGRKTSEIGENVIKHLSSQTGVFIDFYQNFDRVMLNENSHWHSDMDREQAFVSAFLIAKQSYQAKQWQEINSIPFDNLLFRGKLPTCLGFDTKPIPLRGGRATPHQGQIYRSEGRSTSFSPSVRIIADMSDDILHTTLAGGPSDNRFSRWYTSDLKSWIDGDYKKLTPKIP